MDLLVSNTEETLTNLAGDWVTAEKRGDIAFLDRLLTNNFVCIGPRGFMLTKAEWLQRLRSGDLKYELLSWDDVQVHIYGEDEQATIVTGRETQRLRYQEQIMDGQLRTSLFLVRQEGRCQLAGVQFSPIGDKSRANQ